MSTTTGAFIAGGLAACGAVTATHPFETVKIRLQLQGELQSADVAVKKYKGVFHGVGVIVKNEGFRGIYRGIGTAYIYQILLNGCRLGFYEPLRSNLAKLVYKDAAVQSLGINIFSGAASGVLGAMAGSPFFLVKTRLQSYSPFLPVGTQHKYRNAFDGLSQIYKAEGLRGLYRGMGASMVRTGAGSSVQLPTYFFAKRRLVKHFGMEDGPALHLLSSTASGFVVCVFMHPPVSQCDVMCSKSTLLTESRTRSWLDYTISTAISTKAYSIACGRRYRRRAYYQFTRVSPPILRESCRTRS
jgi:solute carrier family 25, member 34/35